MALFGLIVAGLLVGRCAAGLSNYTLYKNADVSPCVPPCVRVGGCGNYPPNPNGPCNITWVAEQCDATYGCCAFNSNGWLKGCANTTCGASLSPSSQAGYRVKNKEI